MAQNTLPFQYQVRGSAIEHLDGRAHARAIETRDIELEDYLGRLLDEITRIKARLTALGG